uniref:Methyltransferase domain-containing protein n=1 Tax=Dunaliella tertiolecta TaxID=3047 RepID=A0A7S3QM00_DUNTE|mmetsp:Transcript_28266/g.76342  ORF Transcript_28266/g.76342 Transcript_28266/m.76342 type:complete len:511 (-) Transcript_28266:482-2014(-)
MLAYRRGSLIGCSLQTVHWLPVQGLLCAKQQGHARSSTRLPSAVPHVTSSGLAATAWSHRVRPTSPEEVPIPLCQRLPAYEAPANAVLAWHRAMGARVAEIGDSFEQQDLGPSESELKRELDWVLDDTVVAIKYRPEDSWMPCSWRFLEAEVSAAVHRRHDVSPWLLQLRASVEQLYEWWTLRLQDRVPFQYLIASAHWRQHVLSVGPGVLIPRPETEIFADLVSEALKQRPSLASMPWVDMGTGSGAIAIAAAEALREHSKDAHVFAVDLSPVAVAYAAANARTTGLSDHVTVLNGSWFEPVATAVEASQQLATSATGAVEVQQPEQGDEPGSAAPGAAEVQQSVQGDEPESAATDAQGTDATGSTVSTVDQVPIDYHRLNRCQPAGQTRLAACLGGVLSNPPYIPTSTMKAGLQAEVGLHEPWDALDGGTGTGLDSLKAICMGAADMLIPGGFIALETAGKEQAFLVASLLETLEAPDGKVAAFTNIKVIYDCFGVPRFVSASRSAVG